MADCGTPSAITGGSVLTSGPYTNGSYAVYTCTSGYVMSGPAYIECMNGTWSVDLPACSKQDFNQVYNYITDNHQDIPNWLLWIFGVIAGLLILLLLACVFAWCLQCLGCFGRGSLFGEMNPRSSPCWCCGRHSYDTARRSCSTFPRKYKYDEDGRRYHIDDNGMACYHQHKNKSHGKVVHNGIDGSSEIRRICKTFPRKYEYDEDGRRYHLDDNGMACYYEHMNTSHGKVVSNGIDVSSEASTSRPTFVQAVNEVIVEKRQQPAKEIHVWKPHANPVRNINTSTK
ncbi:hypothetical protein DPMN_122611 [Dreissena polymorpha]|uniref:Sushi domain-containing protein n=2 Tax=Dreissena polymorpha TaxID=45954 RepID=A0A9D4GVV5_DREPO|nr:hypothetical protein DPMN_122611 [Dreissena polymorpha]